jgi:hypothetical protein
MESVPKPDSLATMRLIMVSNWFVQILLSLQFWTGLLGMIRTPQPLTASGVAIARRTWDEP